MDDVNITSIVTEDSSLVCLKSIRDSNSTSKRSSSSDFSLHGTFTLDSSVLIDSINLVVVGNETSFIGVAISSNLHGRALRSIGVSTSQVDRGLSIGDLVSAHPLESLDSFSTETSHRFIVHITRDENLRGDVDIGPGSLSSDLDTIGESRSGSLSPARSTVLRNVLVPNVSKVVNSIDVVPKDLVGNVSDL
jgi:hypothetical protein